MGREPNPSRLSAMLGNITMAHAAEMLPCPPTDVHSEVIDASGLDGAYDFHRSLANGWPRLSPRSRRRRCPGGRGRSRCIDPGGGISLQASGVDARVSRTTKRVCCPDRSHRREADG